MSLDRTQIDNAANPSSNRVADRYLEFQNTPEVAPSVVVHLEEVEQRSPTLVLVFDLSRVSDPIHRHCHLG